jgi:divalent metal cation (Fe/Co/Zn/Cd) transporter
VWLGFPICDPIVGLLIAVMLAALLYQTGRDVLRRLMDGVDPALIDRIGECLQAEEALGELRIRARWIGHHLGAEVTMTADPHVTLAEMADLSDRLVLQIKDRVPELDEVVIHVVSS